MTDVGTNANGHAKAERSKQLLLAAMKRHQAVTPRFSKLTLPPKYDRFPLLTRLWLQSRVIPPEKGKTSRRASRPPSPDGENKDLAAPQFALGGRKRPFSLAMVWIWLDIGRLLAPYTRVALSHAHPVRLAIYVLKMVIDNLEYTVK